MGFSHKVIKVDSTLAFDFGTLKKYIHEERLTASHLSVDIKATWNLAFGRYTEEPAQKVAI